MAERSCPPYCLGQVIPSQPRSPSLRENAGSTPESHVSTCVVKPPAASSPARNSRTCARTSSAASDGGAGARVSGLLMRCDSPRRCGCAPSVLQGGGVGSAAASGRPGQPGDDDGGASGAASSSSPSPSSGPRGGC